MLASEYPPIEPILWRHGIWVMFQKVGHSWRGSEESLASVATWSGMGHIVFVGEFVEKGRDMEEMWSM